jgi:imidazoleglycerol phosphate dehydratase HisB
LINQKLDNEGRILTIKSDTRESDCLQVYWNGDTPEHSKEVANNQEIFLYATSIRGEKSHHSSISLSVIEAKCLRDTLDYMVRKLEE